MMERLCHRLTGSTSRCKTAGISGKIQKAEDGILCIKCAPTSAIMASACVDIMNPKMICPTL